MASKNTLTLEHYLALDYSLEIIAQPEGGYVLVYPDLPGCMTQVETLDEVAATAQDIRTLWIKTQLEDGFPIPIPSFEEEYSGKFVLRIAKSLHRRLAIAARREGVSLNQYAMALLDRNDAVAQVESKIDALEGRIPASPSPIRRTSRSTTGAGTIR